MVCFGRRSLTSQASPSSPPSLMESVSTPFPYPSHPDLFRTLCVFLCVFLRLDFLSCCSWACFRHDFRRRRSSCCVQHDHTRSFGRAHLFLLHQSSRAGRRAHAGRRRHDTFHRTHDVHPSGRCCRSFMSWQIPSQLIRDAQLAGFFFKSVHICMHLEPLLASLQIGKGCSFVGVECNTSCNTFSDTLVDQHNVLP